MVDGDHLVIAGQGRRIATETPGDLRAGFASARQKTGGEHVAACGDIDHGKRRKGRLETRQGGAGTIGDDEPPRGDSIGRLRRGRSEEHTSELQSLMRTSYAVFCLKKNKYLLTA